MVKKKDKSEREREGRGKMSSMQFKKRGRAGESQVQKCKESTETGGKKERDGVTIKREKRLKDTEKKRQLEKDRQQEEMKEQEQQILQTKRQNRSLVTHRTQEVNSVSGVPVLN